MTKLDFRVNRRRFITGGALAFGSMALTGCDQLSQSSGFRDVLASAEDLSRRVQRLLMSGISLAREYAPSDISPVFRANGSTDPRTREYRALVATNFADWKLEVTGLVENPASFSLADLRALPARTQITRHDCVEGWSCIGSWTGPQLSTVLAKVRLKPEARYVVFRCFDNLENSFDNSGLYYESIDLFDALHPQTILAYAINGETLTIPYGAPLRVRIERQLGYKMAKYLKSIEVVSGLESIGGGKGGYWEDRGYAWYAGI
jgi:DMSO/TMAO reductase YedYZ molybdopterin-dependent catalytic subunit